MPVTVERVQQWAKLVVQSWDDERLKQQLLTDPIPVLQSAGIEFPLGLKVKVIEDASRAHEFEDDTTLVLPLPPRPSADSPEGDTSPTDNIAALSDSELEGVAGGMVRSALSSFRHSRYLAGRILPRRSPRQFGETLAIP